MFEYGRIWTEADEWEYQGYDEMYRDSEEIYLRKLERGMCPHCESYSTVRVESLYQACAERYCRDCGQTYSAEF